MKRLFFLFAFIFIGFWAFGQVDNSDLLIEKKTPKLEKDWYVFTTYWGKLGIGNIFLRDRHLSDIPQRGYGFRLGIYDIGYTGKRVQASMEFFDVRYMFTRPIITNQSTPPNARKFWFAEVDFLETNFAFRVAESGHYIGVHFNSSLMGLYSKKLSTPEGEEVYGNGGFFFSIGLEHTNHFNIKNMPVRVNATLPIVALENLEIRQNWQGVSIKNYFKPTVSVDFFPLFAKKNRPIKISYVCSYANFDRKLGEYYQRRSLTNMIAISLFNTNSASTFGQYVSNILRTLGG